jgi:hypothetical protein
MDEAAAGDEQHRILADPWRMRNPAELGKNEE